MSDNPILEPGTKLPLVGTYGNTVAGNGFVAKVEMRARLLALVDDDGEVWLHAVHPAGWADSGKTIAEAHAVFRQSYTAILYDLAEDTATFEDFRTAVQRLDRASMALLESWQEAVANMRSEWADRLNLKIEPAGQMPYLRVSQVHSSQVSPENNHLDPALPVVVKKSAA